MSSIISRILFLKIVGFFYSSIAITSCFYGQNQTRKPNVLWITCEDIRPALGYYGDDYADTPNLDQLVREGILYRNVFATAPIFVPSLSCLNTGLYATSMGTQHLRSDIPRSNKIKCLLEWFWIRHY